MQISRFDLNLLRSLDALLAHQNVTRAAEQQFVTQQAMSGALHRLREHFEDELLTRVGRRFELTPLAKSLARPVREALLASQAALDTRPSFNPATARRTCRIAMSDYASLVLLPRFLRRLAAEAPNISCHVEQLAEEGFDRVESGDLDFCLAADDWRLYANYRPSASIQSRSLFHDDFVCVTDVHHPTVGDELSLEAFKALPHNLVRFGRGITTIIEQAWVTAGLELNVAATSPSFSGLLFMLPGTSLVATAQRRLALALAPSLGLRVFKSPIAIPPLQENMTWHGRNAQDPGHAFLRRVLTEAAADLDIEQASSTSPACSS